MLFDHITLSRIFVARFLSLSLPLASPFGMPISDGSLDLFVARLSVTV